MVFDIDPDESLGFEHVKQAAIDIRDILGARSENLLPTLCGASG